MPSPNEPIAIIGSGCRFPGESNSPSHLWNLISRPRDVLSKIPHERFSTQAFYHKDGTYHGSMNVQHAYLLSEDFRCFDAQFFNITPLEAVAIDPQQRILLETVYETIENAGLSIEKLQGSDTSVCVGAMSVDYESNSGRDPDAIPKYYATGVARALLSNRISYFFDWHGPSSSVDTACSSSIVALHQAVQTLRNGDSKVAIAAGANLLIGPTQFIATSSLNMLSPQGRSRMWDSEANGYACGEGIAVVALKKLSDAVRDGDHIECVLRDVCINQDGRTKGITTPSPLAQEKLIRQTYARSGLDIRNPKDRCQYFEAHGTGTPAGDPLEAYAIRNAFFGPDYPALEDEHLYVGSIKTVIGHTESTAGLAGILKASLALQHGVIPPNLLFNKLNPAIAPYYDHLKVPTELQRWPELPEGVPRRVSVNCFGFGGTNGHLILEQYTRSIQEVVKLDNSNTPPFTPYVFSAISEQSLVKTLVSFREYLKASPDTNLRSLAKTLQRRSKFPVRASFFGSSVSELCENIDKALKMNLEKDAPAIGIRVTTGSSRILGIFTGQGSQWPQMGKELILNSTYAAALLAVMEKSLSDLPANERPLWSLKEEILQDASRMDLLRSLGVTFTAVVGHSSGEIAAAYAAGYIYAYDGIRIAYFRGFHSKLASGSENKPGAMLAIAGSYEDANQVCNMPEFKGRITIGASNSRESTTLSGDEDAINEAEDFFKSQKMFARRVRVNKAYHSHHMIPCAEPYMDSLRRCNIKYRQPSGRTCSWFSSLHGGKEMNVNDLSEIYWKENMVQTVKFLEGMEGALGTQGPFDLENCDQMMSGGMGVTILKDLPSYQWDHDKVFWSESAYEKIFRTRNDPVHELLGRRCPDNAEGEYRWRNVFLPKEIPWISGHMMQGQQVFPAAGYVVMALDASQSLTQGQSVELIEVQDLIISKPITFNDEDTKVETLFHLAKYPHPGKQSEKKIYANFKLYASTKQEPVMYSIASGKLVVSLGEPSQDALPSRPALPCDMTPVDTDLFYDSLSRLGYNYKGAFRQLSSLKRKLDYSTGYLHVDLSDELTGTLRIHPATLDTAFQSTLAAYSYPGDGRLWSLHIPLKIQRIAVNPMLWKNISKTALFLPLDGQANEVSERQAGIIGDMTIYGEDEKHAMLQAEGILAVRFAAASAKDDVWFYSKIDWNLAEPDGNVLKNSDLKAYDIDFARHLEEIAYRYLYLLNENISPEQRLLLKPNQQRICDLASSTVDITSNHKQAFLNGNTSQILAVDTLNTNSDNVDIRILQTFGEILPSVVKGEKNISCNLSKELFAEYSQSALGFTAGYYYLEKLIAQVTHRYMDMNILEIGTGVGRRAKTALDNVKSRFQSYTYASVLPTSSLEIFSTTQEFSDTTYDRGLDLSESIQDQGYVEEFYDMLIISNVFNLINLDEATITKIRCLLKPGGYMIILEPNMDMPLRLQLVLSSLGVLFESEGYTDYAAQPCKSPDEWNGILHRAGFTGLDTITPNTETLVFPFRVLTSCASDEKVRFIRQPLSEPMLVTPIENLVILGGKEPENKSIIDDIMILLKPRSRHISIFDSFEALSDTNLLPKSLILILTELDEPVFKNIDAKRLSTMQSLFGQARQFFWVTKGCRECNPFASMVLGFGRCLTTEMTHLRGQYLDFGLSETIDAQNISEQLLRMHAAQAWFHGGKPENLVWTDERELVVENGKYIIPRLIPNETLNQRYNASRRVITKDVDLKTTAVEIVHSLGSYTLKEILQNRPGGTDIISIKVTHSSFSSIYLASIGYLFLVIGLVIDSGEKVIAFSETNGSKVSVQKSWTLPCSISESEEADFLFHTCCNLVSQSIVHDAPTGTTTLLHELSPTLAQRINTLSRDRNLDFIYTTASVNSKNTSFISLHHRTTKNSLASTIRNPVSTFYNLADDADTNDISIRINNFLPESCLSRNISSLFKSQPIIFSVDCESSLKNLLETATSEFDTKNSGLEATPRVLSAGEIAESDPKELVGSILSWTTENNVSVIVDTIGSHISFSSDKTYLLLGLAGDLGRSICEYKVRHGARYIVITSRSPKVDQQWLRDLGAMGATVQVVANDATDRDSVRALVSDIRQSLPPIAGVANGAMILRDCAFLSLNINQMIDVLKPKVDSSIHLDELFQEDTLDFFILFSSISSVWGHAGQSNYCAANAFLSGLASQRRRRGLAGSVISIGAVLGLGIVSREMTAAAHDTLRREGSYLLCETDVHQLFAEAVLSSRPDLEGSDEIITGIQPQPFNADPRPLWFDNPKMQRWILQPDGKAIGESRQSALLIDQIQAAGTPEELFIVVKDSLLKKLQSALSSDQPPYLEQGIDELGVDSLIAVDIRSWVLKEIEVEVPTLLILAGITVGELIDNIVSKLNLKFDYNSNVDGDHLKSKADPKII